MLRSVYTLRIAEVFRRALLASLHGTNASDFITGHGYLARDHAHAHFLPSDSDGDGFIDRLDVWLPVGCDPETQKALGRSLTLYDIDILRAGLIATPNGKVDTVAAKRWKTATPVVLNRFPKLRGTGVKHWIDAPEEQIRGDLMTHGLPDAKIVVAPMPSIGGFLTIRKSGGRPLPAWHATVSFKHPTRGPIVLGSLAHFGLGRFEPI